MTRPHYQEIADLEREIRIEQAAQRATFDSTIGRAHVPQPAARPGRIRRWIALGAVALLTGHVIAGDPLGRLKADLAQIDAMEARQ